MGTMTACRAAEKNAVTRASDEITKTVVNRGSEWLLLRKGQDEGLFQEWKEHRGDRAVLDGLALHKAPDEPRVRHSQVCVLTRQTASESPNWRQSASVWQSPLAGGSKTQGRR